ncbi:MAG: NADP-dependent malic enzyme [Oscillospiraceae bacterium]
MDYAKLAMEMHEKWAGKLDYKPKMELKTMHDLSIAYTPGVAQPCLEIQKDPKKSYTLTNRGNLVAVITDGTAVLGLGDIGPEAAMPVMEGKCVLFKHFGGVDAVPLCVRTKNVDEFVHTVALLCGSFGAINLEDIAAPRCFEIERKLKVVSDIPIFHDDQHGTAVVVLAAVLNALKVVGKEIGTVKCVCNGAGAAGVAIIKLLMAAGLKNVIMCDRKGAIYEGRGGLNDSKAEIARITNPENRTGTLAEIMAGADLFIGVSSPGVVTKEMVASMAPGAVLFPMANPVPEIMPELAKAAGAAIIGTGRSDYPNQINNILTFPGILRGTLDVQASDINDEMKMAAGLALASLVENPTAENILPTAYDERVAPTVAAAVADAARKCGIARK